MNIHTINVGAAVVVCLHVAVGLFGARKRRKPVTGALPLDSGLYSLRQALVDAARVNKARVLEVAAGLIVCNAAFAAWNFDPALPDGTHNLGRDVDAALRGLAYAFLAPMAVWSMYRGFNPRRDGGTDGRVPVAPVPVALGPSVVPRTGEVPLPGHEAPGVAKSEADVAMRLLLAAVGLVVAALVVLGLSWVWVGLTAGR